MRGLYFEKQKSVSNGGSISFQGQDQSEVWDGQRNEDQSEVWDGQRNEDLT